MVRLDRNLRLARRAVKEVPRNPRARPFSENALAYAFNMEYVLATKDYRRFVGEATDHADAAVVLLRVILVQLEVHELLVVRLDTLLVEAGQAALLAAEATTFVPARVHLIATFIHHLDARWLATNVDKGGLLADRRF